MSRVHTQDATTDQKHAPTLGTEDKQSTPNNDKASDTEKPIRTSVGKGKEPVTHQKKQMKPNCSNVISIREMMNRRENHKVLI